MPASESAKSQKSRWIRPKILTPTSELPVVGSFAFCCSSSAILSWRPSRVTSVSVSVVGVS